jgi:phage terminase small subunit
MRDCKIEWGISISANNHLEKILIRNSAMPIINNSRREKFAQEYAMGKTATEAMRKAGYSDPRNSTRLTKNDEVRRRVDELKERGAARAEVTIASLVKELEDARLLAVERGQASAAVAAIMGKAKVTGQIIDRAEVTTPGEFDGKSVDELIEIVSSGLGELLHRSAFQRSLAHSTQARCRVKR